MNARTLVDRIKETGCSVRALRLETMKPTTLISYASRELDLNDDQRRQVAAALRRVSSDLQDLACEVAE